MGAVWVCGAAQTEPPPATASNPVTIRKSASSNSINSTQTCVCNPTARSGPIARRVAGGGQDRRRAAAGAHRGVRERVPESEGLSSITKFGNLGVYVTGQVVQPGTLEMVAGVTAVQSIIASGGLSPNAGADGVLVLRDLDSDKPSVQRLNISEVLAGLKTDVGLRPGDAVVRP